MPKTVPVADVLALRDAWRREARQLRRLARATEDDSMLEASIDRDTARVYERCARQLERLCTGDLSLFTPAPEAQREGA